jgi:hypothetical protein
MIETDFLSFPTLVEAARFGCFNCGEALPPASVCVSGNAPRRGAYAMHCEACGMSTFFDLGVAIDPSRPVRVSAKGLKANPDFAGLSGTVTSVRREALSAYFPERGASSIWLADEIENVPLPSLPQRKDELT